MTLDWLLQNQNKQEKPIQDLPKDVMYPCDCRVWFAYSKVQIELCNKHWNMLKHEPLDYITNCMQTGNWIPMPRNTKNETKQ